MKKRHYIVWILVSLIFFTIFSGINVFYGKFHVDEGFYYTAPKLVSDGMVPYRDFIYTQTPLHPYIYAVLYLTHSVPPYWLVRLYSLFWGLIAILLALHIAFRLGSWSAAAIAAGLLCFNGFQTYFFSMIKLYPLTSAFLLLGSWSFLLNVRSNLNRVIAALFFSLSIAVRVSMFPALLSFLVIIALLDGIFSKKFWLFSLVSLIFSSILIAPFLFLAPSQFFYSVFSYNYTKDAHPLWMSLMLRLDVLSQLSREYFLYIILLVLVVSVTINELIIKKNIHRLQNFLQLMKNNPERTFLWLVVISVGGLQAVSKSGVVDEYLTPLFPLAAAILAVEIVKLLEHFKFKRISITFFVTFIIASLINFTAYGITSLTIIDGKNPINALTTAGDYIASITKHNDYVLSFNNALVVIADRKIVPGYEMHVATNDSLWPAKRCEKYRILHFSKLMSLLKNKEIKAIAMTPNSFIGRFPSFYNPGEIQMRDLMMSIIKKNYSFMKKFPELGYFNTDVSIYLVKP